VKKKIFKRKKEIYNIFFKRKKNQAYVFYV